MKLSKLITVFLVLVFTSNMYAEDISVNSRSNTSSHFVSGNSISSFTFSKNKSFFRRFLSRFLGIKFKRNQISVYETPSNNTSIPLDGELGLLLLGGAAFGYRKLRGKKTKK